MIPAETRYDTHDQELLAIVKAFKHWRRWAHSCLGEVEVYTDHKNLTYFTTTKVLTDKQASRPARLEPVEPPKYIVNLNGLLQLIVFNL